MTTGVTDADRRPPDCTGEVELYLPADWIDLLADAPSGPSGDEVARARFRDLVVKTFPSADSAALDGAVADLMERRAVSAAHGIVSHGIVSCADDRRLPGDGGRRWASWNVLTAVVDVPPTSPAVDLGEFLARLLGTGFDPATAYVESFRTEMGCGAGLVTHPWYPSASALAARGGTTAVAVQAALDAALSDALTDGPVQFGLAAAVSCPVAGGRGLLVTGVCMDPDQVLELAGVVALVAGRSRIRQDRPLQDEEK